MQSTFPFGLKILFDAYLINRLHQNINALIINTFLFDAYLIFLLAQVGFLYDAYVIKPLFTEPKSLKTNKFLCDAYLINLLMNNVQCIINNV